MRFSALATISALVAVAAAQGTPQADTSKPPNPALDVVNPAKGAQIAIGSTFQITWTGSTDGKRSSTNSLLSSLLTQGIRNRLPRPPLRLPRKLRLQQHHRLRPPQYRLLRLARLQLLRPRPFNVWHHPHRRQEPRQLPVLGQLWPHRHRLPSGRLRRRRQQRHEYRDRHHRLVDRDGNGQRQHPGPDADQQHDGPQLADEHGDRGWADDRGGRDDDELGRRCVADHQCGGDGEGEECRRASGRWVGGCAGFLDGREEGSGDVHNGRKKRVLDGCICLETKRENKRKSEAIRHAPCRDRSELN